MVLLHKLIRFGFRCRKKTIFNFFIYFFFLLIMNNVRTSALRRNVVTMCTIKKIEKTQQEKNIFFIIVIHADVYCFTWPFACKTILRRKYSVNIVIACYMYPVLCMHFKQNI